MFKNIPELISDEIAPTIFKTQDGEIYTGRNTHGSASELNQCSRMLCFKKSGAEMDPGTVESWGYTERGNVAEEWFQGNLKSAVQRQGMDLLYAGDAQVTLVDKDLSATPDGLITGAPRDILMDFGIPNIQSDCIALEIKSRDPRTVSRNPKSDHIIQNQLQQVLFNKTTDHSPRFGLLVYINASDYSDIDSHVIPYSTTIETAMRKRATEILSSDPMDLMPEGKMDGTCKWCNYKQRCGQAIVDEFPTQKNPPIPDDVEEQISELAMRHSDLKNRLKQLKTEKSTIDEELKLVLRSNDVQQYQLPEYKISYVPVAGRSTLDTESLKQVVVNLDDYYQTSPGSDRLTVRQTN